MPSGWRWSRFLSVPVRTSFVIGLAPVLVVFASGTSSAQEFAGWEAYSFSGVAGAFQDVPGKVLTPPSSQDSRSWRDQDPFEVTTTYVEPGEYAEEQPVGEYEQPLWTTFRRFPTTRVYLQTPPGGVQFEQWVEIRKKKGGKDEDETRVRQELEFGLGHRLQLDLYLREEHIRDGTDSSFEWAGYSAELRYALADWDEIWGNPTLYFEWVFNDGDYDTIEPKLLLGGEIAPGWHWGSNFIHERTLAPSYDSRVYEYAVTASVSRTIVDEVFSAGATGSFVYASEPGTPHREYASEVYLGPSFQFIPHPRAAINVEPLWGLTGESKRMKLFLVFSWHF